MHPTNSLSDPIGYGTPYTGKGTNPQVEWRIAGKDGHEPGTPYRAGAGAGAATDAVAPPSPPDGRGWVVLKGITKQFPGVLACDNIDLEIRPGEVLALLGENGAGKSTLMNILSGLVQPTQGTIYIDGRPVQITSARAATRYGIGMAHQHFLLIPTLTVAQNVVLGVEPQAYVLDYRTINSRVADLARSLLGFELDPELKIEQLSVGARQRVEILKVLYRGARILILDEPTAVLTPQETLELFRIIRRLVGEGRSVVFISHKLKEVLEIADRIVVLRAGRVVGETTPANTDEAQLAAMMVGRKVALRVDRPHTSPGQVVLKLEEVSTEGRPGLRDVWFEVRAGEIFGIAGVDGNGQTELEELLVGLRAATAGNATLDGRSILNLSPRQIRALGVAHIPSDRARWGIVPSAFIWENAGITDYWHPPFGTRGLIHPRAMEEYATRLIRKFDIRATGPHQVAGTLSGGNQQKLVVGRELQHDARLVVTAQPTRGMDIGATEFIHRQLIELRSRGAAVLLISADLDEVMSLSDRIGVLYAGRLMGIRDAHRANREELGLMMAGVTPTTDGIGQSIGADIGVGAQFGGTDS